MLSQTRCSHEVPGASVAQPLAAATGHILPHLPASLTLPLRGLLVRVQMEVMGAFCLLYVGMQTFAIPGTITLSLLAGGLFGFKIGLPLVAGTSSSPFRSHPPS